MKVEKVVRHHFPAVPGERFELDAELGAVRIAAGDGEEIRVEVLLVAEAPGDAEAREMLERIHCEFLRTASGPLVRSRVAAPRSFWRRGRREADVTFSIAIPCRQDLVVETRVGDVAVAQVLGDVSVRTGAGAIGVDTVQGEVCVETASGPIEVCRVEERVTARTRVGDVRLLQIGGPVEVSTVTGEIAAEIVRQPRSDSRLTTSTGSVSISLPGSAGFLLDAATRIGQIVNRIPSFFSTAGLGGSLRTEVNGGGPRLTVRTSVGEVSIRPSVPA
ncbi:MAG TPA: DUF4097 family beta strand repeat-containing protein [Thermoanaerobaculia bacterium]|jgi:hypothetical protein|nr:DUF4097 family beta strand repeat-containing protein [Thermoanaerobaculia bacterium]